MGFAEGEAVGISVGFGDGAVVGLFEGVGLVVGIEEGVGVESIITVVSLSTTNL